MFDENAQQDSHLMIDVNGKRWMGRHNALCIQGTVEGSFFVICGGLVSTHMYGYLSTKLSGWPFISHGRSPSNINPVLDSPLSGISMNNTFFQNNQSHVRSSLAQTILVPNQNASCLKGSFEHFGPDLAVAAVLVAQRDCTTPPST